MRQEIEPIIQSQLDLRGFLTHQWFGDGNLRPREIASFLGLNEKA